MKKKQRTPYRPRQEGKLERIEARRARLGVTHQELAETADIPLSTYRRIRTGGRAWAGQVTALRFALRTIEQKRRAAKLMFEGEDE